MPITSPMNTDQLKALSHPVRIALLESLSYRGALTATQVAEIVGESPSNCSWHLRRLASVGLVERAPADGQREHPWRITFNSEEFVMVERDHRVRALLAHRQLDRMLTVMAELGCPEVARDEGEASLGETGTPQGPVAAQGSNATWLTEAEAQEVAEAFRRVLTLVPDFEERRREPSARPEGAQLYEFAGWFVPVESQL